MWKEYKETFDGVHASQRLKTEVMNMKREEDVAKKRRIPAAVLVAAILVVVLAGTAVAREYFGRVSVVPESSGSENGVGYSVYGQYACIPAESLPEDVLTRGAGIVDYGDAVWTFASRSECEVFLKLDLMNNAELERLPQRAALDLSNLDPNCGGALVSSAVDVFFQGQEARSILVWSLYGNNSYQVTEQVVFRTDKNSTEYGGKDRQKAASDRWNVAFTDYTTPNGMEVTITTETDATGCVIQSAHFASSNAIYWLELLTWEEQSEIDSMKALKELLDAYE